MSSEDKLVSITLEDLDSLIDCYERPGNSHTTLDSLFALRNYQRWLKDPQSPKVIYLDILTVNNHWDRDGLFLLVVSKQINITHFVCDYQNLLGFRIIKLEYFECQQFYFILGRKLPLFEHPR